MNRQRTHVYRPYDVRVIVFEILFPLFVFFLDSRIVVAVAASHHLPPTRCLLSRETHNTTQHNLIIIIINIATAISFDTLVSKHKQTNSLHNNNNKYIRMSFVQEIMAPGGGILLLPFIRVVVGLLLFATITVFLMGVARIHMAILSFLSGGLLISLQMFETAYHSVKANREGGAPPPTQSMSSKPTDKSD